jgi:CheY-like chemotaxis protein
MVSSENHSDRPTILIAEDDVELRDIVAEILESSGYDVVAADDGEQAIAYLTAAAEVPAAVLLDLMMPVASGWDCLDALKSDDRLSWIPVVIMSELDEAPVGADLFLKKPFRVDELLATIDHFARPRPDRGNGPAH